MHHPPLPTPLFSGLVELRPTWQPRPEISHVVFDFDGTLSWLRHGWPEMMVNIFRNYYPARDDESESDIHDFLLDGILRFNGKPTIFQTLHFAEVLKARGGPNLAGETLRQEYQATLDEAIAERSRLIRTGQAEQDAFVVHGARPFLEHLRNAGLTLIVLSSTVEERVREEAELLDLTQYFDDRIYGGRGDPTQFSKRAVFERILREDRIPGSQLFSFGDGPVEIADTKALGGIAVALCSDENQNGSGEYDAHKKTQLLAAGADAALPDYRDAIALMNHARGVAQ